MLNKFLSHPVLSVSIRQPITVIQCQRQPIIFRQCHQQTIGRVVKVPVKELPRPISVKGWVKSLRKQKQNTFLDISDGVSGDHLQVVADTSLLPDNLNFHSCVSVQDSVVTNYSNHSTIRRVGAQIVLFGICIRSKLIMFGICFSIKTDYIHYSVLATFSKPKYIWYLVKFYHS